MSTVNEEIEFKSTNNLLFEVAPGPYHTDFPAYRVGTCTGIYTYNENEYVIVGVANNKKGNGHLNDVFEWFENSCKRDNKDLVVAEIMNKSFMKHLIEKRGFEFLKNNYVIKSFRK
jgi:hypothetical protein